MAHSRKRSFIETGTHPLLSHTSILIISIFVLGMATGTISSVPENSVYLMMGVFGLISYFGLGTLATNRERKRQRELREKRGEALEGRLERHLINDSQINSPQRVATVRSDQTSQYLTVNKQTLMPRNHYS
ncbi:MAG: hypothetical protein QM501_09700 [Gimesia sp.]